MTVFDAENERWTSAWKGTLKSDASCHRLQGCVQELRPDNSKVYIGYIMCIIEKCTLKLSRRTPECSPMCFPFDDTNIVLLYLCRTEKERSEIGI